MVRASGGRRGWCKRTDENNSRGNDACRGRPYLASKSTSDKTCPGAIQAIRREEKAELGVAGSKFACQTTLEWSQNVGSTGIFIG